MPGQNQDNSNAFYEFERAGWERVAGDYHRYFAALTTRFIDPLLDAGGVRAGSRVLDVATGPGYVAAAAARRGAEVVGIDFAEAAVALARQQHPAITFQTGSAEKLPFPDAIFDTVVMNFGLLHVAQPELALAEAYRVLHSGGRVAFTVWGDPNTCLGFKIILNAIAAHGAMDVPLPEGPPFFRFSDPIESKRRTNRGRIQRTLRWMKFTLIGKCRMLTYSLKLFSTERCAPARSCKRRSRKHAPQSELPSERQ